MAAIAVSMWTEPTQDAPTQDAPAVSVVTVDSVPATIVATAAPPPPTAVAPTDPEAARREELARIAKSDIWQRPADPPRVEVVPIPQLPTPTLTPQALALQQQRHQSESERDRVRHAEVAAQIEQRAKEHERALQAAALAEARGKVRIDVYTAARCANCRQAIAYLAQETEVRYTLHDINSDPGARDRMRQINPAQSVPTLVLDDTVLIGFSPRAFESALDAAARKRAGLLR